MLKQLTFTIYVLVYTLLVIALGLNSLKIGIFTRANPRVITMLLPMFINFVLGNFIFRSIPPFFSYAVPFALCFFLVRKLENVRIFGVTGNIATGKSTLIKLIFRSLTHVDVIDCDQIAKHETRKDQPGYKSIVQLCGEKAQEFLDLQTQQIERQKFTQFLFQDKQFRQKLTKQIGKIIIFPILKKIAINIINKKNVMIIDAPMLYETKILQYICYPVIVVGCEKQLQVERLCKRGNYSQNQAKVIVQSQMPLVEKREKCQIYLNNNRSEDQLLKQFLTKINPYMQKKFNPKIKLKK